MSNTQQQRVRRIASPSMKSGPMKATLTFGLRQGSPNPATTRSSNGRKISPSSSPTPTWGADSHRKTRRSPDNRLSPDRAASSSPGFKEKQKILRPSPVHHMKRTGSFDTITPYLKGEWPKGDFVPVPVLQVSQPPQTTDQATQTPEEWEELLATDRRKRTSQHKRSSSAGNGDSLKELQKIKAKLSKNSKDGVRGSSSSNMRASPVQGKHVGAISVATSASLQTKAMAMPMPMPKPTIRIIRNSVEGPSQEIEKLVYKQTSGPEEVYGVVQLHSQELQQQDGHRAPVRDLLAAQSTRTVDTQTPSEPDVRPLVEEDHSCSSSASDSPSLPIIPGNMDSPLPSSRSDSSDSKEEKERDLRFIREPPDGCERVRIIEEASQVPVVDMETLTLFCPIKNPQEKCTIPSHRSAFLPLLKPYVNQPSEMALRTDPPLEGQ